MRTAAGVFAGLVVGAVAGIVGTFVHRSVAPWGLVLALVLVLSATVTMRSAAGFSGLVGCFMGWFVVVQIMSYTGPGGDVVVPATSFEYHGYAGMVWLIGGAIAILLVAFAPRRWVERSPK